MNFRIDDRIYAHHLVLVPICFYLILSPVWAPGLTPRLYDNARCLELGLLALVVMQLLLPPVAKAISSTWLAVDLVPRVLISVLIVGGTLSAYASGSPRLGALEIALLVQLVILCLFVCSAVRAGQRHAETVLAIAACAGAALFVLKFWVTYILYAFEGKIFPWLSPFLDFANIRFFSQYQAYTLFLMVLPVSMLRLSKTWMILVYFIAANFWALQWIIGTRAVWAGFVAAILVVFTCMGKGKLTWLRQQAIMVSAGALIYLLMSYVVAFMMPDAIPVPGVKSMIARGDSIVERIDLAKSALEFIGQWPLLGVGPGQFGLQAYSMNAAHPHNVPLQLLSEYGLPAGMAGIALGVLLMIFVVKALRTESSAGADMVGISLMAALIMGLTDAMFSGNLIMPHAQILFCVVSGWFWGRKPSLQASWECDASSHRTLSVAVVSIAVLAVATTTMLGLAYLAVVSDMPPWLPRWNPHFWQYGRLENW